MVRGSILLGIRERILGFKGSPTYREQMSVALEVHSTVGSPQEFLQSIRGRSNWAPGKCQKSVEKIGPIWASMEQEEGGRKRSHKYQTLREQELSEKQHFLLAAVSPTKLSPPVSPSSWAGPKVVGCQYTWTIHCLCCKKLQNPLKFKWLPRWLICGGHIGPESRWYWFGPTCGSSSCLLFLFQTTSTWMKKSGLFLSLSSTNRK
jgi:hypothetical protein